MARRIRTSIIITDVQAKPSHINEKGIEIEGIVMIGVQIKYGRKFQWQKAYGFSPKELKNFNMEEFKNQIYQKSRIWIKEAELQDEALSKIRAAKSEPIYLD